MPDKDNFNAVIEKGDAMSETIVRRLTPEECEALQGFPKGWTAIGVPVEEDEPIKYTDDDGKTLIVGSEKVENYYYIDRDGKRKKATDSNRYKALGNSIALPFWWWLVCKMEKFLPEKPTMGSLFDGIGGFPLVWEEKYGKGSARWASEIESFPIEVTRRRFPEEDDEIKDDMCD